MKAKPPLPPPLRKRDLLRGCLFSPHFWALLGTPLPPLNVVYAFAFWLWCRLDRPLGRMESALCLNVQLTYTIAFYLPLGIAVIISSIDEASGQDASLVALRRLATGFPLGILSLLGIVLLAFFNVRSFAAAALGTASRPGPRLKFLPESFV